MFLQSFYIHLNNRFLDRVYITGYVLVLEITLQIQTRSLLIVSHINIGINNNEHILLILVRKTIDKRYFYTPVIFKELRPN